MEGNPGLRYALNAPYSNTSRLLVLCLLQRSMWSAATLYDGAPFSIIQSWLMESKNPLISIITHTLLYIQLCWQCQPHHMHYDLILRWSWHETMVLKLVPVKSFTTPYAVTVTHCRNAQWACCPLSFFGINTVRTEQWENNFLMPLRFKL